MAVLTKEQIELNLKKYYIERYGDNSTDYWYEQPAVNVWVFSRDGKIITLKCHILTGAVSETIQDKRS